MKDSGKGGDSRRGRKKHPKRRGKESPQAQGGAQPQSRAPQGRQQQARPQQARPQQGRGGHSEASKGKGKKPINFALMGEGLFARKRVSSVPRPKWAPPQPPELSLPAAVCIWCDKPIREFSTALTDPDTGKTVHFDCAVSRITERERLEKGDAIGYIGAGRFGVIHFDNPQNAKKFRIKKVLEWEDNEVRSEWRVALYEHFSIT